MLSPGAWRPSGIFALSLGLILLAEVTSGLDCGKSSVFDNESFFSCPRPFDDDDAIYCCADNRCCNDPAAHRGESLFGEDFQESNHLIKKDPLGTAEVFEVLPKPERRSVVKGLAKVVGIVIAIVVVLVVTCIICCCCCPFCLLAKRRRRGEVLQRGNDDNGRGHGYQQGQGYPQQPGEGAAWLPSNPDYPPPQQQVGGYGPGQYPPAPSGFAYPAPAANMPAYPPPYSAAVGQGGRVTSEVYQKQPSFNPNY